MAIPISFRGPHCNKAAELPSVSADERIETGFEKEAVGPARP